MGASKRTALRFVVYIRALGGQPLPFDHWDYRTYAAALQSQFDKLRQAADPAIAREARIAGRALIREKTLTVAAGDLLSAIPSMTNSQREAGRATATVRETSPKNSDDLISVTTQEEESLKSGGLNSKDRWNCRRKLRHRNYLSALHHASRLEHPDLNIYPCTVCDGLHVGHDSTGESVRWLRKASKKLRAIESRLHELDRERQELEGQKKTLLEERRCLLVVQERHLPLRSIRKSLLAWFTGSGETALRVVETELPSDKRKMNMSRRS